MTEQIPPTRWELGGAAHDVYAKVFAEHIANGTDIDGEARLADALLPRAGRVLDAGSGIGRVAAALAARGHRVVAVEKDAALVAESQRRWPDVPVVTSDILGLSPALLGAADHPAAYDVVVCVGNVLILTADGTNAQVLTTLGTLLAEDGRLMVGFRTVGGPANSRDYPWERFAADVVTAGLTVEHRFGSYELRPPSPDYVVAVLARAD